MYYINVMFVYMFLYNIIGLIGCEATLSVDNTNKDDTECITNEISSCEEGFECTENEIGEFECHLAQFCGDGKKILMKSVMMVIQIVATTILLIVRQLQGPVVMGHCRLMKFHMIDGGAMVAMELIIMRIIKPLKHQMLKTVVAVVDMARHTVKLMAHSVMKQVDMYALNGILFSELRPSFYSLN